jgi:hypothetical protein
VAVGNSCPRKLPKWNRVRTPCKRLSPISTGCADQRPSGSVRSGATSTRLSLPCSTTNYVSGWPTRRSQSSRLLSLFAQSSRNQVYGINVVDIIKSWRTGRVISAPSPLASHRATETDATNAVAAHPLVNNCHVLEVGAGCCAAPETIFDSECTAIGERVKGSLLLPTAVNKSAPNELLTHENEWSAPDHAEPLKRSIGPIRPIIP